VEEVEDEEVEIVEIEEEEDEAELEEEKAEITLCDIVRQHLSFHHESDCHFEWLEDCCSS
jgi:hypothetical protein